MISLYTTQIPAPKVGQKDEELNFKWTKEFAFDKFSSSTQGWMWTLQDIGTRRAEQHITSSHFFQLIISLHSGVYLICPSLPLKAQVSEMQADRLQLHFTVLF